MNSSVTKHDMELGALVRLHRIAKGLTLAEVASRAKMKVAKLLDVETGKCGLSVRDFERLAAAVGVSPPSLLAQLQSRCEFMDGMKKRSEVSSLEFLASNRGRQLIRALAGCHDPRLLDAISKLLSAATLSSVASQGARPPSRRMALAKSTEGGSVDG